MNNCIFCYEPVDERNSFYHTRCHARSCIAGIEPIIPYSLDDMHELATKVVGERITVTGVQPKISLNTFRQAGEKSKKLTIINYPGAFILKPPSPKYEQLPENEDLTMKLARASGIATVPFCLVRLQSGEAAYDLLNTKIVVPEDNEQSALTINGKKNRITLKDFDALAEGLKIPEKAVKNIYKKFSGLKEDYSSLIGKSFLSDSMKEAYQKYVEDRFTIMAMRDE